MSSLIDDGNLMKFIELFKTTSFFSKRGKLTKALERQQTCSIASPRAASRAERDLIYPIIGCEKWLSVENNKF